MSQPLNSHTFQRRYGINTVAQLVSPHLQPLKLLELPLGSVYHYLSFESGENGPASDDFLFRFIKKPIFVEHVVELVNHTGSARKQTLNEEGLIREYHNFHRRMRRLRHWDSLERDPNTLGVVNYSLLNKQYRYVKSLYSDHHRWLNLLATWVQQVSTLTQSSQRQHFLLCAAPQLIPSVQQLSAASQELTTALLQVFRDRHTYLLLELWKWLGLNRGASVLGALPPDKLHLINLVYQESGQWCVLNLGRLNAFRKAPPGEAASVVKTATQIEASQLQKYLLRMVMSVMEARTAAAAAAQAAAHSETQDDERDAGEDADEAPLTDTSDAGEASQTTLGEKTQAGSAAPEAASELPSEHTAHQVDDEETDAEMLAQLDRRIDEDLAQLNEIAQRQEQQQLQGPRDLSALLKDEAPPLEDAVTQLCNRLADDGLLSHRAHAAMVKQAQAYKSMTAPDGKTPMAQFIQIPPEMLKISASPQVPDSDSILDKSMLKSSLIEFDARYVEQVLARDTAAMTFALQRAGIAVTDYKVERVTDALGRYDDVVVKLAPVEGQPSTLKFKLPVVEADGTFQTNGVKYRLRKQRGEVPIHKTSPTRVALTSYYGKTFVDRSRKKINDYGEWLSNQVMAKGLDKADTDITNVVPAYAFDHELAAPRAYSALAMRFNSFTARGYEWLFNQKQKKKQLDPTLLAQHERDGAVVCALGLKGCLVMDPHGALLAVHDGHTELLGTVESFLNLDASSAPVEFTEVKVFGKEVPVGVVLAYRLGLTQLLKALKVQPRRVTQGRLNLQPNEWALRFNDETLVFYKDDRLASMILGGFLEYKHALGSFSVYSFDQRGVYLNLLETAGLSGRYIRELDLMFQLFVDPITRDLLLEMQEPTTLQGLLIRACELLLTDQHPRELDGAFMRVKGYERIAGSVYTELVQAVRAHNGSFGKSTSKVSMSPYAVWKRITEDPAKSQVNEINPIEELKGIEALTMSGTGGRMRRSMVKRTRAYDPNDMGTVSEATVDSSDVAINMSLSADAQFTSLRGISRRWDPQAGVTSLLSTSALTAAASDTDDPRRVNFVSIQQSHVIGCSEYHQAQWCTGYEQVIPHRTSDLFAFTAKKPGVVESLTARAVVVAYDDGERTGYEIGRRYGQAAGLVVPHDIVTPLKVGDKVAVGDAIVYNTAFFEPFFFNPKQLAWKNSINARVVLWESKQTLDDASSISLKTAQRLTTRTTKTKHIVVGFQQGVAKLVKEGDFVTSDTPLCYIEDEVTANAKIFDDATLDTLKLLSKQSPRAGVKGTVEKIEVFYHGDKEDMSPQLREIADAGDKKRRQQAKELQRPAFTGSVDGGYRIEGTPLALDTMAIVVYITSAIPTGIGDKGVFANQMKTVFSEVLETPYRTEDGRELDAIFGQKSIDDRIVHSPETIGTTMALLNHVAREMVALWEA